MGWVIGYKLFAKGDKVLCYILGGSFLTHGYPGSRVFVQ